MNSPLHDPRRLQKILALLDSPHEGEAIAALVTLRTQLGAQSRKLADLLPPSVFEAEAMATEIADLRNLLTDVMEQAETDRVSARNSQQALSRETAAVTKWRALAQNTADRLWEIGQQLHEGDLIAELDASPKVIPLRRKA